jgi:antitoxin VapB
MSAIAKLFVNGGSQAVRLPKELRFEGTEVRIRKLGNGVLLEPMVASSWPQGYWEKLPRLTDDDWERPNDGPPAPIEHERDLP